MAKRKQKDDRADMLAEMVADAIKDKPASLVEELDSIVFFLRMWQRDYGDENEPRLSMITGMIADLATIIAAQELLRPKSVSK